MRTWKWMITASLLVTLSATAQQTANPSSPSNTPSPDTRRRRPQPVATAPATTAAGLAAGRCDGHSNRRAQASQPRRPAATAPVQSTTPGSPTTMDQSGGSHHSSASTR